MLNNEQVTISKAYLMELEADALFLSCLIVCGVNNWGGYSDAQELAEGYEDEDAE